GHCVARLVLQLRKLAPGQDRIEANRAVAPDLTVDLVVAIPAPSVEHVCILADTRVEETSGGWEGGGAASDAVAAGVEDDVVQSPTPRPTSARRWPWPNRSRPARPLRGAFPHPQCRGCRSRRRGCGPETRRFGSRSAQAKRPNHDERSTHRENRMA